MKSLALSSSRKEDKGGSAMLAFLPLLILLVPGVALMMASFSLNQFTVMYQGALLPLVKVVG